MLEPEQFRCLFACGESHELPSSWELPLISDLCTVFSGDSDDHHNSGQQKARMNTL